MERQNNKVKADLEAKQEAFPEEQPANATPLATPLFPYIPPTPDQPVPKEGAGSGATRDVGLPPLLGPE